MAVSIRIPTPLRQHTDGAAEVSVEGGSVAEVVDTLEAQHPGIRAKVFDDSGDVRRFINIFLNGEDIRHLEGVNTGLKDGDELSIVPAIAGGLRTEPAVLRAEEFAF
jgi:molybdopterin synthase sulfur carrier subunit